MKINGFVKAFKFHSIRKDLLTYSLVLIVIMLITSVYTFYNAQQFSYRMNYMFVSNKELSELSKDIVSTDNELVNYLITKSSNNLDNYNRYSYILKEKADKMGVEVSYDKNDLMLKDIANMIGDYLFEADKSITARRVGDITQYNDQYLRTQKISQYIRLYIDRLNLGQFKDNTDKYFSMTEDLKILKILNIVIIIDTLMLTFILILWFTRKISVPIITLSNSANEISKGNFSIPDVEIMGYGELKVMSDAFNSMKNNIKIYIEQLHTQAETEAKLMDEKMQNLKFKNLLKNAELHALQSQINPHFLYNSFNAGVQLAMIEGADRTGDFLEKLSNLFRYNLREMDKPVTLRDEINNLHTYIYILRTRFDDLYNFEFDIDEDALEVNMPAMILEPLVENACLHGIGDMESGGKIKLCVKNCHDFVQVSVEDNGKGMPKEQVSKILNLEKTATTTRTTGIGLKNVIQRMRIFFDDEDVISIDSDVEKGTRVTLKLSNNRGIQNV